MSCCGSNKTCCDGAPQMAPAPTAAPQSCEKQACCTKKVEKGEEDIRNMVREHYKKIVCSPGACSSGSCFSQNTSEEYAPKLGYTKEDLAALPEGSIIYIFILAIKCT